jgi:hypothetical protein
MCGEAMTPFQTVREIAFNGKLVALHHRCWYENQDAIKMLEETYPGLSLEQALRKSREGRLA